MSIFLSILFVLLVSSLVLFMFGILLPALKNNANFSYMVFPQNQAQYQLGRTRDYPSNLSMRAVLPDIDKEKTRLVYDGKKNCHIFLNDFASPTINENDCIGFGTCAVVCPQDAICIKKGKFFLQPYCIGCNLCVVTCPKNLIVLRPIRQNKENIAPTLKTFRLWKSCTSLIDKIEKKFKTVTQVING